MSLKTLIVLCIFAGLIVMYLVYMAGEMSKSTKKLEAFQEAAESLKASKETKMASKAPAQQPEEDVYAPEDDPPTPAPPTARTKVTTAPTAPVRTATTMSPATTAPTAPVRTATTMSPATTESTLGTFGPAAARTSAPTARKDYEKSLFIVNKYEEIFGTKIGPEELEQLTNAFAEVDDKEVIAYKMREMKYRGTDEIDTIFQLADVSERLSTIVGKLKARAGSLQNAASPMPPTPSPTMAAFATSLPPVASSPTKAQLEAFSANRKYMPY